MARYMLHMEKNQVYPYHAITIQRPDMVEISEKQAHNILNNRPMMEGLTYKDVANPIPASGSIPAVSTTPPAEEPDVEKVLKGRILYLEKKLKVALDLLNMPTPDMLPDDMSGGAVIMDDLEGPLRTEEAPAAGVPTQEVAQEDEDILWLQQVLAQNKGKAQVEAYMIEQFGLDVDHKMKLPDMVEMAIKLRRDKLDNQLAGQATTAEAPPA